MGSFISASVGLSLLRQTKAIIVLACKRRPRPLLMRTAHMYRPILTYDRRGCSKKGVRPSKHGIIYMAGTKPRLIKNEPELGFSPVALHVYADGEKLAKESRVNYSKLVTIEHNVKVFFIGSITGSDFEHVRYAVNDCWDKKMHRSSRKSGRR